MFNVGSYLPEAAEKYPEQTAILSLYKTDSKKTPSLNFRDLNWYCDAYAHDFQQKGIGQGTKTVVMVKPGIDFIAVTFALFKIGAVPVLIDPGMGRKNMAQCILEVEPEAFVGIPLAHLFKFLVRRPFRTIKTSIVVKSWNKQPQVKETPPFQIAETLETDLAAILFTSGSTGVPKGVLYQHGNFAAQVKAIQETYKIQPGETDIAAFPLFALFGFAMGTTVVIPDMDPTKPAEVDPRKFVQAIQKYQAASSFGSPAIWRRVVPYCIKNNIVLDSITRVLIAGAPVPGWLLMDFQKIIKPESETYTPYGATESLPVASISGSEVASETWKKTKKGQGICVGKPLAHVEVFIIKINDGIIRDISEVEILANGEIGEIIVKGKVVTQGYFNRDKSTKLSKISDGNSCWHRMGDVGYLDEQGRLWFVGRKDHRVEVSSGKTLYPIQVEALYNNHPDVFRSALVGLGDKPNQKPLIIIEPEKEKVVFDDKGKAKLEKELRILAEAFPDDFRMRDMLFHSSFPVDVRHNAKIVREKLAVWAEDRVKKQK